MIGIAEIGHFTLSMALASAMVMAMLPMIGASQNNTGLMRIGRYASLLMLAQITIAFGLDD